LYTSLRKCYIKHCPLSAVHLTHTTFQKLPSRSKSHIMEPVTGVSSPTMSHCLSLHIYLGKVIHYHLKVSPCFLFKQHTYTQLNPYPANVENMVSF